MLLMAMCHPPFSSRPYPTKHHGSAVSMLFLTPEWPVCVPVLPSVGGQREREGRGGDGSQLASSLGQHCCRHARVCVDVLC